MNHVPMYMPADALVRVLSVCGLSVPELAERSGVSDVTIYKLLAGAHRFVRVWTADRLCIAIDRHPITVFGLDLWCGLSRLPAAS